MIESTATPAIDAYAAKVKAIRANLREGIFSRTTSPGSSASPAARIPRCCCTWVLEAIHDVAPDDRRRPVLHRQQQHARQSPVFQDFVDRLLDKLEKASKD